MNYRNLLILVVIFTIIFSVNMVSATNVTEYDFSDCNLESVEEYSSNFDLSNNVDVNYELSESFNDNQKDENNEEYVIYVGNNTGEGNGSENNPYATLDLACNNVSTWKEKVVVKVFDGTYYLGSHLEFNTSNLHIIGLGDNVIIKNMYTTQQHDGVYSQQAFGLVPSEGNFTISNIIFDGSTWTEGTSQVNQYFNIFKGSGDYINYIVSVNNCTFLEFNNFISNLESNADTRYFPYIFERCKFLSTQKTGYKIGSITKHNTTFKNCIFNLNSISVISSKITNVYVSLEDCWFGINGIPDYFYGTNHKDIGYHFNSYAIFKISENYLGNNTYEIIGNLFRNGTSEIIEDINPMEVTLSTDSGILDQTTVTLEKGTFKVRYTSNSSNNKITATLYKATEPIEFKSINISLDSPTISYGDNQNITVTLPSEFNGVIYVTVNNKTYIKDVDLTNVVTVNITNVLPAGTYDVNVTFVDTIDNETCPIYGFNTTTITVLGIPYELNATVPETLYLGDNATVTLKLPEGATGNVTVKVGENEAKTFNIADTISIGGFIAGDNIVNITYNGNEKYESQSIEKHVFASLKPTALTADNVTTIYGVAKDLVVTLTSNGNVLANKNITIIVGTINKTLPTDANGQVSVDISTLSPSTYTATISFEGDELYNKSSITAKVSIKENAKTENITLPEITAGKATTTTIKLPENATGNITVSIDGSVSSVVNLTNGSATITIPALTAGKHNITIAYSGDDKYAAFSQTSTVEVKEPAKPTPKPEPVKPAQVKKQATKIMAKNKKFKAKTKVKKYTITLKTKAGKAIKKVQVTIKIGKKTYKAKTNAKGKATFKIKKLTKKGKYKATIKFKGNKLYKACSKKVKITIKK